jgi:hypothetical protein
MATMSTSSQAALTDPMTTTMTSSVVSGMNSGISSGSPSSESSLAAAPTTSEIDPPPYSAVPAEPAMNSTKYVVLEPLQALRFPPSRLFPLSSCASFSGNQCGSGTGSVPVVSSAGSFRVTKK